MKRISVDYKKNEHLFNAIKNHLISVGYLDEGESRMDQDYSLITTDGRGIIHQSMRGSSNDECAERLSLDELFSMKAEHSAKKLTVAEINKLLGYKVEIVE